GDIDDAMRFVPSTAFGEALPEKSFIELLSRNPQPGTTKPLPRSSPRVTVTAATLPSASTTLKCVVCALSLTALAGSLSVIVGVARFGLIEARHCDARSSERRSRTGTRANAGSPRYLS